MVLEPIMILHERDHAFVKREKRGCGFLLPDGTECGKGKGNLLHFGAPASLNASGSGANRMAYQNAKKTWMARLIELLQEAGLQPAERFVVEGEMCFPTRTKRDQGNFRFFIEKALGDALVEGRWLTDDDWDRYEFGNIQRRYSAGVSWTRLILFPQDALPPIQDLAQAPLFQGGNSVDAGL